MTIKGKDKEIRLPLLGKIKLGINEGKHEENTFPGFPDYFICPDEVKKVFGEKPDQLRVMFPPGERSQWAGQYFRCYSRSKNLICRGDGKTALAIMKADTAEIAFEDISDMRLKEVTCEPDSCIFHQQGWCRKVLNLQFMLPDCPDLGVYQLDVSCRCSIENINSAIDFLGTDCSMRPLSLSLEEQEVYPEGSGKKVRLLSLKPIGIYKYAMIAPGRLVLLPPPDLEVPGDLWNQLPKTSPLAEQHKQSVNLLDTWRQTKRKIWQLDVRDKQVADWFQRNYGLDVKLSDFILVEPPGKLTLGPLQHFLKALEQQARHL